MFNEAGGGGSSYGVDVETLVSAAIDVSTVAGLVRAGLIDKLDDGVDVGHARLQLNLAEFTSRWSTAAEGMIHRQYGIADALRATVADYVAEQERTAAGYRASCPMPRLP